MLLNLCTNARHAMPGGGRLDIRLRACTVPDTTARRYGLSAGGRFAELTVADTGSGMTPEVLGRLWEPFYTTKDGGTGLGLAVVYGVVESHQGFVQVDSLEGEGSRFRVYLPLQPVEVRSDAEPKARPTGVGEGTVLLAEDEPMLRELIAEGLTRLGYQVVATGDGAEAIAAFGDGSGFAAAVLDVVMPGLGGARALAHIRATVPGLPVLMISGHAPDAANLADVLADPHTELLSKPFQVNDLGSLLEELIGRTVLSTPESVATGD